MHRKHTVHGTIINSPRCSKNKLFVRGVSGVTVVVLFQTETVELSFKVELLLCCTNKLGLINDEGKCEIREENDDCNLESDKVFSGEIEDDGKCSSVWMLILRENTIPSSYVKWFITDDTYEALNNWFILSSVW